MRLPGSAARVLVRSLGGIWNVRRLSLEADDPRLRSLFTDLNYAYWACFGAMVGHRTVFGDTPTFPHGPYGVFISGEAEIGAGAVIFQHVTIGSNVLPDSKGRGAPRVGDNCFVGAGAALIGGIRIGDRVRVGANCVVTTDVPSDSVVVAQPARIVHKEGLVNRHHRKDSAGRWIYVDGKRDVLETDQGILALLNDEPAITTSSRTGDGT